MSETSTLRGKVGKDSLIVECIGDVDEANAFIGLAKVFLKDGLLEEIQRKLFKIGSEIAGFGKVSEELEWIQEKIKELEKEVEKPRKFLILEKDAPTAFLSVARAVVRRAERSAVKLHRNGLLSQEAVEFLNKLSYLLYLLILKVGKEFEEV